MATGSPARSPAESTANAADQAAAGPAGTGGRVGRGERAKQRVLAAALEQLADGGASRFTMEAVARRAGASKATLYRHWPSASALLVDAMAASFRPFPTPDTGDVRGDIAVLLGRLVDLLAQPRFPRLMAAVVDLAERDSTLGRLHADLTGRQREPALAVLRRGQERGEVDPEADLEILIDLLTAPFFYRRFIAHRPIPRTMVHSVIAQALPPR